MIELKFTLKLLLLLLLFKSGICQTPQIALVKPDGTTTIHSTLQAANNAASDGDYVFLPGGSINGATINKKLFIYGAGVNLDSSAITHTTDNIGSISIQMGGSGGSIEGVRSWSIFEIGCNDYIVKNCYLGVGVNITEHCSNNLFLNNFIGNCFNTNSKSFNNAGGKMHNSFFVNNFIDGNFGDVDTIVVKNNIFLKENVFVPVRETYENNIFKNGCVSAESIFNNNVNITIQAESQHNVYNNNFDEAWPDIFIDPGIAPYEHNDQNDYHIKATSLCKNSGTDGTDRGIYGGTFPWVEGSVPSNPHIFYKSVGAGTNANGQLHIHYKVRAQDN